MRQQPPARKPRNQTGVVPRPLQKVKSVAISRFMAGKPRTAPSENLGC